MMRRVPAATALIMLSVIACGGGSPTTSRGPASVTATRAPASAGTSQTRAPASVGAPSAPSGNLATPEGLCGLLQAADWQQFNYVTAATPDVTSDGEGTAICTWADGLTLEVYTDETPEDAAETFNTVVENVPMDDPQPFYVQRAAQSVFDADIGDGSAGMAAQAGRLTVFVSGLSRDTAQVELATLAGLVISRGATLI